MKKQIKIFIALFVAAIALATLGFTVNHAIFYSDTGSTDSIKIPTNQAAEIKIEPDSTPKLLNIPSLGIKAKVQDVGITAKGNMATPNNFTDVGWYKYGTVPGKVGSAIMAGHIDNGLAFPGVFKHLGNLKKGDDIYVEMENGKSIHYIVSDLNTYAYNADAKEVFEENDDRYLKLITCTGTWVKAYGTHDKRLVVTAIEA